jgi:hypothetical protein
LQVGVTNPFAPGTLFSSFKKASGKEAMAIVWHKHFSKKSDIVKMPEESLVEFRRFQFLLDDVQTAVIDDLAKSFLRDVRASNLKPLCDHVAGPGEGERAIVLASSSGASSSKCSVLHSLAKPAASKGEDSAKQSIADTKSMLLDMFGF